MPQSPPLRVLLIEDSASLAARLIELVNPLPDVDLIDTVDTEADALDRISAGSPDVLILDLHLREGSGFGVLRPRTQHPAAPENHRPNQLRLAGISYAKLVSQQADVIGRDQLRDEIGSRLS